MLLSCGSPGLRVVAGGLLECLLFPWPSQNFWQALAAIVLQLSEVGCLHCIYKF